MSQVTIQTQEQLEIFAHEVRANMPYLPENLRLLIIMEPDDFDQMIQHTGLTGDRFIYNSHAGVEFGIKRSSHEQQVGNP